MNIMIGCVVILLSAFGASLALQPVDDFEVEKYLGRWYQVYTNEDHVANYYKTQPFCHSYDCGVYNETTLTYHTARRNGSVNADFLYTDGLMYITDQPGLLHLDFPFVPFLINYTVVKVGPDSYGPDNLYRYVITVGRSSLKPYFVRTRDLDDFRQNYQDEVLDWLEDQDFPPLGTTPQPKACVYEPLP